MKRTALKRGKPLRRKTWMKSRSAHNAYRRRPRDIAYMRWVKRQQCSVAAHLSGWEFGPCEGPIEADHAGRRGLGQKAGDDTCIPLCRQHHHDRGTFSGGFRGWNQEQMRTWLLATILFCQSQYAIRPR